MGSNAAKRQRANEQIRRCRQLQREGKVRLCVVVNEADLVEALRVAQFVRENDSDPEGAALEAMLQNLVDLWIEQAIA